MASLNDIMLALGRLQEGVERLSDDFVEEKRSASASRAAIHQRLDAHVGHVAKLEQDAVVAAAIGAQTREEVKAIRKLVDDNHTAVQPSIAEWQQMKKLGLGLVGLLALGGLTVGAVLVYMGDVAVTAVRAWLRIN